MAISYNAADYIDKTTALAACDKIIDYAGDYRKMGIAVQDCASDFSADVLSVEGQDMQNSIRETGSSIKDVEVYIEEIAELIKQEIIEAYNKIQEELNEKKARAEETAEAAKANSN